ncbi:Ig-like domain-containing protein [Erysipelothrix rhusiopathiae]|nr:Ig-like domain-containing protein [Erysipelothrix rhusiopathiae]
MNQPNVNDTNVSGKGVPGDEIIISDPSGKELGKGIVKEDGTFEIELNRPLLPNEEITATPNTDGKSGTPTKETVYDAEGHKPTLNQPNVNDTNVSGKGVPGDVLPSTGISQLNIVVYSGYVLVVLGVFLTVFKRKHSS